MLMILSGFTFFRFSFVIHNMPCGQPLADGVCINVLWRSNRQLLLYV